jgi:hypothetical protein
MDLDDAVVRPCAEGLQAEAAGPPYLGDLGTADDRTALLIAVQRLRLGQSLPDEETALLTRAVGELTQAGRPAPA